MTPYAAKLKRWRTDERGILQFFDEELKVKPDPWQEQVALLFRSPRAEDQRIAMQACAGPGKSAVMSWCGWWFLSVQGDKFDHPKGLATSITDQNLKANLWAEFATWQQRSTFLMNTFTWTSTRIFATDHPATWFLEARSWPKTANPEEQGKTFSGLHAKYVLILVDESGAIPTPVGRAAEQALSVTRFGKYLQAGNPISLEGLLYEAATKLRHMWRLVRITGDPDDPHAWVHSPRVMAYHKTEGLCSCPVCWAKLQIETYGRENPWVKSYILGMFPPASINALLGVEEVEAAIKRQYQIDAYQWSQKRLGVDVARFGDDRTVIFPRQGIVAFKPVVMRQQNTMNIAARVAKGLNDWGAEVALVDDSGHWGHGVIDSLTTAGYPCIPILGEDQAIDQRYKNRRAEMWLEMAKWVRAGGKLPAHVPELVAELTTPTYTFLAGKFVLEPKDQIKKRLGRSPDLADALAETFAIPDQPAKLMAMLRGNDRAKVDEDPFNSGSYGEGRAAVDDNPFDYRR